MAADRGNNLLYPGVIIKPSITEETAQELTERLYGFKTESIKEMYSYDDRNYHVKVSMDHRNPFIDELCPFGYTLKVMNFLESKIAGLVDGMHRAMDHLYSKGLDVPLPMKNLSGNLWSMESFRSKKGSSSEDTVKECSVRLLTYLPGTPLYFISYTPVVLYQWGSLLGKYQNAMQDFHDDLLEQRTTSWSLLNVHKLTEFLFAITDENKRYLVEDVIMNFTDIVPKLQIMPKGLIHGDFNEHNILALSKNDDSASEKFIVYGILDFGDLHLAPLICDVAVMLTYSMIECRTMEPICAAGHAMAGYFSQRTLSNAEFEVLKVCIAARFCQSLVMGAYSYSLDQSNEYVISTSRTGWNILEKLWSTPQNELYQTWKSIMDAYS